MAKYIKYKEYYLAREPNRNRRLIDFGPPLSEVSREVIRAHELSTLYIIEQQPRKKTQTNS